MIGSKRASKVRRRVTAAKVTNPTAVIVTNASENEQSPATNAVETRQSERRNPNAAITRAATVPTVPGSSNVPHKRKIVPPQSVVRRLDSTKTTPFSTSSLTEAAAIVALRVGMASNDRLTPAAASI